METGSMKGMLDVQRAKCRNDIKQENKDKVWTSMLHGLQANDGSSRDQHHPPAQRLLPFPHPLNMTAYINRVLREKNTSN